MDPVQRRRWLAGLNQYRKQDPEGFAAWMNEIERTLPEKEREQSRFLSRALAVVLGLFMGLPLMIMAAQELLR